MAINDKNMAESDFWCNIAAESIYNSADRRAKAVDTLKTLISWAFGIFSTGGFAVSLFGNIKEFDSCALKCFGVAFFLLTVAYCIANMAQYPVAETYNAQDPREIAIAFSKAVKKQTHIFNIAVITSSIGFFLFALGLLQQFGRVKSNSVNIPLNVHMKLNTCVHIQDGKMFIPIIVKTGRNDDVNISIYNSTRQGDGHKNLPELLFAAPLKADSNGILNYSYCQLSVDTIRILTVVAIVQKKNQDTIAEERNSVSLNIN